MDLSEFAKKFTVFKPTPYHEALFKVIEDSVEEDKGNLSVYSNSRRWYKDLKLNEFIYSHLIKMAEGQTFAVASLEGIHIFKKIEFRDQQGETHEH